MRREGAGSCAGARAGMLACLVCALASGCPRERTPHTREPPTVPTATAEPAPEPEPEPEPETPCGEAGLEVGALDWLPPQTRAAIVLELQHEDLGDALARLGTHTRGDAHGLPIDLAFALGHWPWQIPAVRATLRRAGLQPGSIAFVRTDEPTGAFALVHTCDVDELRRRTSEAWGVTWRTTVEGALGRAPSGVASGFPWDVLLLPGQRVLLVAAGRGDAWVRALSSGGPSTVVAGGEATGARLGRALAELPDAPVRGVLTGRALVDPHAPRASDAQTLRVTAEGVEVGASLQAPP